MSFSPFIFRNHNDTLSVTQREEARERTGEKEVHTQAVGGNTAVCVYEW